MLLSRQYFINSDNLIKKSNCFGLIVIFYIDFTHNKTLQDTKRLGVSFHTSEPSFMQSS